MNNGVKSIHGITGRDWALIINAIKAYSHNTEYSDLLSRLEQSNQPFEKDRKSPMVLR